MITGINKLKELEDLYQIIVYEINSNKKDRFQQILNYRLPKKYQSYSKTFLFDTRTARKSEKSLILLSKEDVVCFNFSNPSNPKITQIYHFNNPLKDQPDFAEFSADMKYGIVASIRDALWFTID
jgi:hypothetical protein